MWNSVPEVAALKVAECSRGCYIEYKRGKKKKKIAPRATTLAAMLERLHEGLTNNEIIIPDHSDTARRLYEPNLGRQASCHFRQNNFENTSKSSHLNSLNWFCGANMPYSGGYG